MAAAGSGTSGVDWGQARNVFTTLLVSPAFGFIGAAILLLLMKLVVHDKRLYEAPDTAKLPPRSFAAL
jgi:inorganic phosphate transporter, PiT family